MRRMVKRVVVVALLLLPATALPGEKAPAPAPTPEAVGRARDTVQMLDAMYKMFVVHITDTYVEAKESIPAAKPAKKVMQHMTEKGFHSARLIDATGEPLGPTNVAKTDFEKKAVAALKSGKTYLDEVGEKDGKPVLRAATIVPVVMKQCAACHTGRKRGDLLGAIVYELPIK
ncbi:MAG: DUF3365 domain-containing protein [Gemmataceae bacterium]